MKTNFLLLLIAALGLSSCGNPFEERSFNSAGSQTRSNSYENFGNFAANVITEKYYSPREENDNAKGEQPNEGSHFEPLVVGASDFYLPCSDGTLSFISQGKFKFKIKVPDGSLIASKPAADINRNVYCISLKGILYSFSVEGKKNWEFEFGDESNEFETFSDVLAVEDGVIVGSSSGNLIKLSLDGKVIFKKQYPSAISKSFACDAEGNIIFGLTFNEFGVTDSLAMITSKGDEVFTQAIDYVRIIRNPIVVNDNIYIGGFLQTDKVQGSIIACYDKKGKEKWRQEIPVLPRFISANKKGDILAAGYNTGMGEAMSGLFAFNSSGKQIWRLYLSATVTAPLLVGNKKICVIGNTQKGAALFFLDKETGKMIEDKSLTELPLFNPNPAVLPDGSLIFSVIHKLGVIRITDTSLNKILPW